MSLPPFVTAAATQVGTNLAISGVTALLNAAKNIFNYDADKLSVTQSAKRSSIRSRAYIDSSLSNEAIVPNILRVIHTSYVGMIVQTIQLASLVSAGHSVGQALSPIATRGMESFEDVVSDLRSRSLAIEAAGPIPAGPTSAPGAPPAQAPKGTGGAKDSAKKEARNHVFSSKDTTPTPADSLPVGKMVDITLTNPDHPEATITVPLLIQILPYYVKPAVAETILTLSAPATFGQRLVQWSVGEIRFVRDLLLKRDLRDKMESAVKTDATGSFADYLINIEKRAKRNHIREAVMRGANSSSNIANSVLIVSAESMNAARAETGFNPENRAMRDKFFKNSLAMILVVVDPSYNTVTMYLNGLDDVGHYSFDNFSSPKKSDNVDIVQLLAALTQGRSPRF